MPERLAEVKTSNNSSLAHHYGPQEYIKYHYLILKIECPKTLSKQLCHLFKISVGKLQAVGASDYALICVIAWMIGQGQPQARWPSCEISRKLLRALWNPSIRAGGGLKDKPLHGTWFMTKLWTFWSWMVKSRQRPEAVGGRQQPPFLQRNVNRSFNLTSLIWGPETVLVSNDQQLLSWSPFWVILNILCHSSHLDC